MNSPYQKYFIEKENTIQMNTPEFKKWFGNSKIVDKSGKPKIVYHGTNKDFSVFDTNFIGASTGNFGHHGYGIYFSFDVREAKGYGNKLLEVYLNIQKPFYGDNIKYLTKYAKEFGGYEKVNVAIDKKWLLDALKKKDTISYNLAFLILKKGYELGWEEFLKNFKISDAKLDLNEVSDWIVNSTNKDKKEELNYSTLEDITHILGKPKLIQDYPFHSIPQMHYMTNLGDTRAKELTELIKKGGYDGIIVGTEIVAFYPYQIKSAVNNNGNFDKNKNSIYEDRN